MDLRLLYLGIDDHDLCASVRIMLDQGQKHGEAMVGATLHSSEAPS